MRDTAYRYLEVETLIAWSTAAFIIGVVTMICIWASKHFPSRIFTIRKVLHIVALTCSAYAISYSQGATGLLGLLFLGASVLLTYLIRSKLLSIGSEDSFGIPLFAGALGLLLLSGVVYTDIIVIACLVLGWSDPAASLIGKRYGRNRYLWLNEEKSAVGSLVFAGVTTGILLCHTELTLVAGWPFFWLVVLMTTISEALSIKGSDNLSIPTVLALLLQGAVINELPTGWMLYAAALLVGLALIVRVRWLTTAGGITAGVLAISLLLVDPLLMVFPVFFLAVGSLLSKISRYADSDRSGRSAAQVLSNGLPALIAGLLGWATGDAVWSLAIIVSFGVALADTVSSEVGRRYGGIPFDILSLRKVPPGLSGGVSLLGSIAALFAAVIYASVVYGVWDPSVKLCLFIGLSAYLGMVVDSVLGSWLQAKYRVGGQLSDRGEDLAGGYQWMTNNLVNLLAISTVTIVFVGCYCALV